jgi:hypothetical protein
MLDKLSMVFILSAISIYKMIQVSVMIKGMLI